MRRSLIFMGRTQQSIDSWPDDIREIIKTNLQAEIVNYEDYH